MFWWAAGHKISDGGVGVICECVCIFFVVCMFEGMQALPFVYVFSSVVVNECVGVLTQTHTYICSEKVLISLINMNIWSHCLCFSAKLLNMLFTSVPSTLNPSHTSESHPIRALDEKSLSYSSSCWLIHRVLLAKRLLAVLRKAMWTGSEVRKVEFVLWKVAFLQVDHWVGLKEVLSVISSTPVNPNTTLLCSFNVMLFHSVIACNLLVDRIPSLAGLWRGCNWSPLEEDEDTFG